MTPQVCTAVMKISGDHIQKELEKGEAYTCRLLWGWQSLTCRLNSVRDAQTDEQLHAFWELGVRGYHQGKVSEPRGCSSLTVAWGNIYLQRMVGMVPTIPSWTPGQLLHLNKSWKVKMNDVTLYNRCNGVMEDYFRNAMAEDEATRETHLFFKAVNKWRVCFDILQLIFHSWIVVASDTR